MSKCPVCSTKKGKRPCIIVDSPVCSLCCGKTRKSELCLDCNFYQKPKREYGRIPAYSVAEMDGDFELEDYGNAIEGAICSFDIENGGKIKDETAIHIVERLLDIYHFQDQQIEASEQIVIEGVEFVNQAIKKDLRNVSKDEIVKILGVIRFVAKRRTKHGKEYMNIIHKYVGQRVATGVRLMTL